MDIRMVVEVVAAAELICTVQLYAIVKTSARIDRLISTCTLRDVNTDCDVLILSHIFNPRQ